MIRRSRLWGYPCMFCGKKGNLQNPRGSSLSQIQPCHRREAACASPVKEGVEQNKSMPWQSNRGPPIWRIILSSDSPNGFQTKDSSSAAQKPVFIGRNAALARQISAGHGKNLMEYQRCFEDFQHSMANILPSRRFFAAMNTGSKGRNRLLGAKAPYQAGANPNCQNLWVR